MPKNTDCARTMRRAFTLVEILLVIALIGISGAIIVANVDGMLASSRKSSPYEVLRKAVDTAWYEAATGHVKTTLSFDPETRTIRVRPLTGTIASANPAQENNIRTFPFEDTRVTDLRFIPPPDEGGGSLQTTLATEPLTRLLFSPYGGVTPAIVEMDMEGQTYRYRIDTFGGTIEAEKN
ncbi:MAG: type II secretion system GspH family protein [Puniceicoccales bacterium]|nr:type II secretion system GspH family protein [Puniceicoccales bacterium]